MSSGRMSAAETPWQRKKGIILLDNWEHFMMGRELK